jgi:hypothetical protein
MSFILNNYSGFGDNIYHIPFVHQLAKRGEVFMFTPFPELFQFPNVFCFPRDMSLKTQVENSRNNTLYCKDRHPSGHEIHLCYGQNLKRGRTVMQTFEEAIPLDEWFFEFTPKPSIRAQEIKDRANAAGKKLCVVRLPSVRQEWFCTSRNGEMEGFQACIDHLKDTHYIVAVGDIGNREEYDGVCPTGVHEHCDRRGPDYLPLWDMVYLLTLSDLVLSIQCNILPLCQILRKRAFFIYGGYVPHALLNDQRFYQVGYVEPDPFCFCVDNRHSCNKHIPRDKLISRLEETLCQN